MFFDFDEDQEQFRTSLRRLLQERAPLTHVRECIADAGWDVKLWALLTAEMGVPGLHVAERDGGSGFSHLESAIVAEELGRMLSAVPFLSTCAAMEAVRRCGSPGQRSELLPSLASGERVGTLAVTVPADVTAGAVVASDGTLTGTLPTVADGAIADLFVVPATDVDGAVALHVVDAAASGLRVEPLASLDLVRPVARLVLDSTPATRLLESSPDAISLTIDTVRALLAFEALGAARASLDLATEYAKTRTQFNRPIGSFQAVKHKLAEMAIEIDATEAAAMFAVLQLTLEAAAQPGSPELARARAELSASAPIAKAQAAETLRRCAGDSIQVHGGIGFTWEHDAHLYFRRAKSTEVVLGSTDALRDLAATRAGL